MDGPDLRAARKRLGLSQSELAKLLGISRDFIGQMERGVAPIAARTALAMLSLSTVQQRIPSNDPMERIVEEALTDAGIDFVTERDGDTHNLDFYLPQLDLFIEVKRMHSPRIAQQTARVDNVIVAQGEKAVRALATALRGDLGAK